MRTITRELGAFCRAMAASTRAAAAVAGAPNSSNAAAARAELESAIRAVDQLSGISCKSAAQTLRARAAAMRTGEQSPAARKFEAPAHDGWVKLVARTSPPAADVRTALSYAKFLSSGQRGKTVYLCQAGQQLYMRVLNELRELDRHTRTTRTLAGERQEVIRRLECMDGGGPVKLTTGGIRLLNIARVQKFMQGDTRMIRGWASTGDLDRQGDIVVASGMQVSLPVSLLWAHDAKQPIGSVVSAQVREGGVWIEATLVSGIRQADEAAILIDAGAIDSFSIGFRGLKYEPIPTGLRYTLWEMLETSVVAVPANPSARIRRSA